MLIEIPGVILEIKCQAIAIDASGAVNMLVNDAIVHNIVGFFWRMYDIVVYLPREYARPHVMVAA